MMSCTLEDASVKLFEFTGLEAESGALIRQTEIKTSFFLDCGASSFIMLAYGAPHVGKGSLSAMRAASKWGLAPEVLHHAGRSWKVERDVLWGGYHYFKGQWIGSETLSLPTIYRQLGSFAAALHRQFDSPRLPDISSQWPSENTSRAEANIIERLARPQARNFRRVLIHGDLNATNLLREKDTYMAVDFDEAALGRPEHDLAISLAYVNTTPDEYLNCFQALSRGYTFAGGVLDTEVLRVLAITAPMYVVARQVERMGQAVLKKNAIEDLAHRQMSVYRKALAS